jgi:hypothetical protein
MYLGAAKKGTLAGLFLPIKLPASSDLDGAIGACLAARVLVLGIQPIADNFQTLQRTHICFKFLSLSAESETKICLESAPTLSLRVSPYLQGLVNTAARKSLKSIPSTLSSKDPSGFWNVYALCSCQLRS